MNLLPHGGQTHYTHLTQPYHSFSGSFSPSLFSPLTPAPTSPLAGKAMKLRLRVATDYIRRYPGWRRGGSVCVLSFACFLQQCTRFSEPEEVALSSSPCCPPRVTFAIFHALLTAPGVGASVCAATSGTGKCGGN